MSLLVLLATIAALTAVALRLSRSGRRDRWSPGRYYSAWDPESLWTRHP